MNPVSQKSQRQTIMPAPFDTLKMVEQLECAGMPTAHAKAITAATAESVAAWGASLGDCLCSKPDLRQELLGIWTSLGQQDSRLNATFTQLANTIDRSVAELKRGVVRWVVIMGVLQAAMLIVMTSALPG